MAKRGNGHGQQGMAQHHEGPSYDDPKTTTLKKGPAEIDHIQSAALDEFLRESGVYETREGDIRREEVLGELEALGQRWVRQVYVEQNFSEATVQATTIKLYTFGSYRMKVHGPGTDMDVLCVGPRNALREKHFFGSEPFCMERMLKEHPNAEDVVAVPDAIVPVIKFKFFGISFDLVYVPLVSGNVPDNLDINGISIIRNVDQESVTNINGRRVTDRILEIVPDVEVFRVALRFVKLWAKKRGVYGNVLGYLGGVNWALLVAFTYKSFPMCTASMLIMNFFKLFSYWTWPTPVLLEKLENNSIGLPNWDARSNYYERSQVMPIITPAYPAFNSSYSVSENTLQIMVGELHRASKLCGQLLKKSEKGEIDHKAAWSQLVEPLPFFEQYFNFLKVQCVAASTTDLLEWSGWVSSRLRRLVNKLAEIVEVRLWPQEFFDKTSDGMCRSWFWIGVKKPRFVPTLTSKGNPAINISHPVSDFRRLVVDGYKAHIKPGMTVDMNSLKQHELPDDAFISGVNPARQALEQSKAIVVVPSPERTMEEPNESPILALPKAPSNPEVAVPGLDKDEEMLPLGSPMGSTDSGKKRQRDDSDTSQQATSNDQCEGETADRECIATGNGECDPGFIKKPRLSGRTSKMGGDTERSNGGHEMETEMGGMSHVGGGSSHRTYIPPTVVQSNVFPTVEMFDGGAYLGDEYPIVNRRPTMEVGRAVSTRRGELRKRGGLKIKWSRDTQKRVSSTSIQPYSNEYGREDARQ